MRSAFARTVTTHHVEMLRFARRDFGLLAERMRGGSFESVVEDALRAHVKERSRRSRDSHVMDAYRSSRAALRRPLLKNLAK